MPVSVTMPRLGESVTEGTVTRWLKNEGEHVDADEPLLEVSTDKVDTEVPSPAVRDAARRSRSHEDETVEIGVELAVIGEAGEAASTPAPAAASRASPPRSPRAAQPPKPAAGARAQHRPSPSPSPSRAARAAPQAARAGRTAQPRPAPAAPAPAAGRRTAAAARRSRLRARSGQPRPTATSDDDEVAGTVRHPAGAQAGQPSTAST